MRKGVCIMEKTIAQELLKIKAVFLSPNEPFTWASGIKSPIYCDNRLTLSYPKTRTTIIDGLVKLIEEKYSDVEYIMGTATAGIAHASLVADKMKLPMGYVRSSSKDHGRNNQIEGKVISNAKVVVIEDLISTGGSSISVVNTLREAGFKVLGVVSIFTYLLDKAKSNFDSINCTYHSLTNYDILKQVALDNNYIAESDLIKLTKWRENPSDESWIKL